MATDTRWYRSLPTDRCGKPRTPPGEWSLRRGAAVPPRSPQPRLLYLPCVQSLPSPADSFCYLDWQIPAQEKMRCRQTRIAWLGWKCASRPPSRLFKPGTLLPDGDAGLRAHESPTSNPAGSGSQITYLTTNYGFEPQLDFRSPARIELLAGAMSSSRVCLRGDHAACDHEDARRKIAAPDAQIRITTRLR